MKKPADKKKDPKKAAAEGIVEIRGDPESLGLPTEKFYTLIDRDFWNKYEVKKQKKVKVEMSEEDKKKAALWKLTDKYDIIIPMKEWLTVKVALNQNEHVEPVKVVPDDPKAKKPTGKK